MNIGRACGIFLNIESDNFTEDEKLVAIRDVLKEMVTYNGITKDNILKAFRWFFDWAVEETTEDGKDTNVPSKWIPCSERLPDSEGRDWVLAQVQEKNGYMWLPQVMEYRKSIDDWYDDSEFGGWLKERHGDAFKVIAWMPLPPAYKEDKE